MTRIVAIVQARVGSTRLPGKVLADIQGTSMLLRVVRRAEAIEGVTRVVVATSSEPRDEAVVSLARGAGVEVFAGSENDVLDRYYRAACAFKADAVVRITADCPLLDPEVSGSVLRRFREGGVDYATNCRPPTFPDGLDTEVIAIEPLERAWKQAALPSEREHVTPYIWKRPEAFALVNVSGVTDLSGLRWTVDDARDLEFARAVYDRLLPRLGPLFGMHDVLKLLDEEPLSVINAGRSRGEGYAKSIERDCHDV